MVSPFSFLQIHASWGALCWAHLHHLLYVYAVAQSLPTGTELILQDGIKPLTEGGHVLS